MSVEEERPDWGIPDLPMEFDEEEDVVDETEKGIAEECQSFLGYAVTGVAWPVLCKTLIERARRAEEEKAEAEAQRAALAQALESSTREQKAKDEQIVVLREALRQIPCSSNCETWLGPHYIGCARRIANDALFDLLARTQPEEPV